MTEVHGIGAYGIVPFMSDDLQKLMKKFNHIPSREGRIAYIMLLGKKAKKPEIHEGVYAARGALKWIEEVLNDNKDNQEGQKK
ncbi:MAG: hypothetical protein WC901_02105 [Candidatus Margulisiibacteriota bacterium]